MARDPYRTSAGDLGYGGRPTERWDSERFNFERDRNRFGERDRFEERDTRSTRGGGYGGGPAREHRESSVDEFYERRGSGPRGRFEDDRYERRTYYEDDREPWHEPQRGGRGRNETITMEKERDFYSPSPPRPTRPGMLRRQSSLDTFDRRPIYRFREKEEYGPPARYQPDIRPQPLQPVPLPRARGLPMPPRRYAERDYERLERDIEEIKISEPEYYEDDEFHSYPERMREREVVRTRKRSHSGSRAHSKERTSRGARTIASSSRSSSSSSSDVVSVAETVRTGFPKKGKTRMPARLVSKAAIAELGYTFVEEDETIIIQMALGPEHIDEVIKLSEEWKIKTAPKPAPPPPKTIIEEKRIEEIIIAAPPPPPPVVIAAPPPAPTPAPAPAPVFVAPAPPPPPPAPAVEVKETNIIEVNPPPHHHNHHHDGALIIDSREPREEMTMTVARSRSRGGRDRRSIQAEILALEAQRAALDAEARAEKDYQRRRHRSRNGRHHSEGEVVLYERDRYEDRYEEDDEEVTIIRKERIEEPSNGVRLEKDRKEKGPPPKLVRAMLATLT